METVVNTLSQLKGDEKLLGSAASEQDDSLNSVSNATLGPGLCLSPDCPLCDCSSLLPKHLLPTLLGKVVLVSGNLLDGGLLI